MNGRRLLLFAAVLLGVGALASAVAPREEQEPTTPATSPPPAVPERRAAIVTATLPGRDVRVRVGDFVRLTVRAPVPGTVVIEGRSDVQPVDADSPAHFGFIATRPGTFPVRVRDTGQVEGGRLVGRLVVVPRPRAPARVSGERRPRGPG